MINANEEVLRVLEQDGGEEEAGRALALVKQQQAFKISNTKLLLHVVVS